MIEYLKKDMHTETEKSILNSQKSVLNTENHKSPVNQNNDLDSHKQNNQEFDLDNLFDTLFCVTQNKKLLKAKPTSDFDFNNFDFNCINDNAEKVFSLNDPSFELPISACELEYWLNSFAKSENPVESNSINSKTDVYTRTSLSKGSIFSLASSNILEKYDEAASKDESDSWLPVPGFRPTKTFLKHDK